jgi:prepilin-type N-terminal cleavage/methylation domain-containing protein
VRRKGFSLIEIVMAIAIFAAGVIALTQAFSTAVRSMEMATDYARIERDLAFLRRYVLRAPDREQVEEGGRATALNTGIGEWEVFVEATEVVDLFRVEIAYTLAGGSEADGEVLAGETLWLLRPDWSLPDERSALLADKKVELFDRRGDLEWLGKEATP